MAGVFGPETLEGGGLSGSGAAFESGAKRRVNSPGSCLAGDSCVGGTGVGGSGGVCTED